MEREKLILLIKIKKNRGNSVNNFKKKIDINDFIKQNINFFLKVLRSQMLKMK